MTDIRQRYHIDVGVLTAEGYKEGTGERTPVAADDPSAVLVSSEIEGRDDAHAPAIDIDHPVHVVPSSTPGHSHLYIDVPLTWDQYERLLAVMAEVGIVEPGYVRASVERKATFLRLPHVRKGAA